MNQWLKVIWRHDINNLGLRARDTYVNVSIMSNIDIKGYYQSIALCRLIVVKSALNSLQQVEHLALVGSSSTRHNHGLNSSFVSHSSRSFLFVAIITCN